MLYNLIRDDPNEEERHIEWSEEEYAHQGLLLVVLSVIFMNQGALKEDCLYEFLKNSDLYDPEDLSQGFHIRERDPEQLARFKLDTAKQLIENIWSKKHHYINISRDPAADPDNPKSLYEWGPRAKVEIKRSDVLKFVAHIYNKNVDEFSEEYKEIIEIEGKDCFKEEEENDVNDEDENNDPYSNDD